jgi:lysophospholipase L1-like esterase
MRHYRIRTEDQVLEQKEGASDELAIDYFDSYCSTARVDSSLLLEVLAGGRWKRIAASGEGERQGTLRVMILGDSLAGGYYASVVERGFAARVLDSLGRSRPVDRVEVSHPGGTTRAATYGREVPADLDVVVVELGTNDSLRTPPWRFARTYDALLKRIRDASPEAHMVCLGLWRQTWRASIYDRIIRRSCERHEADFRRLSDIYERSGVRGPADVPVQHGRSDTFHPNDHGHQLIAERVMSAL